nr:MAG TPA: hypothetical protein [Caudoviricetes sp.]
MTVRVLTKTHNIKVKNSKCSICSCCGPIGAFLLLVLNPSPRFLS